MPADYEPPRGADGLPALRVPKEGDVIAGKYRVEAVIGLGAMGMVIAAHHEHLGERVALKTLLPHIARDPDLRRRFQREAQAAFKLQNEHVCRVFDAGTLDDGSPFLVMEFLKGDNLSQVLAKAGRLPVEVAVDYVIQACDGIAAAHDLGIIHRDIKPANLFLTTRPDGTKCVKVIDFGISKLKVESQASVTGMNAFLGSPIYSAPEQLNSAREVTPASDVWSLGVVLYQLLLGRYPFDGDFSNIAALFAAVLGGPIKPTLRDPSFPRDLERVIMSALDMDPQRRCPSARAFARSLKPFELRLGSAATVLAAAPVTPGPPTEPMAAPTLSIEGDPVTTERETRREPAGGGPPETMSVPPPLARPTPTGAIMPAASAYAHPTYTPLTLGSTRVSAAGDSSAVHLPVSRTGVYAVAGVVGAVGAALAFVALVRPALISRAPTSTVPSLSASAAPSAAPALSADRAEVEPQPSASVKTTDDADAAAARAAPALSTSADKPAPSTKPAAHAPRSTPSAAPKNESGPSLMKDRHGI